MAAETNPPVTTLPVGSHSPMTVAVLDGNGDQVTAFGGTTATQYTEGDTDTTITGTAALAEGPSDTLQALQVDASKHLQVDIAADSASLATAANQSTSNTHLSNAAASLAVLDDWDNGASDGASVSGDVAHGTADAGEPVKVGLVSIAHGTNPTAVDAADRTNWYANRAGVPFVIGGHPNIVTLEAAYTALQTDTAIVTVGSGVKIVVTQTQVLADEANTVGVGVRVGFGTANTPTTTGVVLTHPGLVPGSGVSRGDGGGILGVGADNEDLRITSDVPTGGSIRVLVSYYTIES